MPMAHTPTPEQQVILDLARTGDNLRIEAGAGTGKSTVLKMIAADQPDRSFLYVAFNRTTVDDANRNFPRNVTAKTSHGLASTFHKLYAHRLKGPRQPSWILAKTLGMGRTYLTVQVEKPVFESKDGKLTVVDYEREPKVLQPGFLAGLVMRALNKFYQTADDAPGSRHIPWVDGIDFPDSAGNRTNGNNTLVRETITPFLTIAWADICDVHGTLPFPFNAYLKQFQLTKPVLDGYDAILFDEAQDANACVVDIVANQTAQLIFVGDTQQQIYEWNGAVNALAMFPAENTGWLTQSWRFGQTVADVANDVLGTIPGAVLRLSGNPAMSSTVNELPSFDAMLCRTNAHAVVNTLDLVQQGRKVALVGGADEVVSFARAAEKLMDGKRVEHPELAWAESWDEVLAYVEADKDLAADLKVLVDLVQRYTVKVIIEGLGKTVPENRAEVMISTCHRAKGREWARVVVAGDFPITRDLTAEEKRLLYVAVTRAQVTLDITRVAVLNGGPRYDFDLNGDDVEELGCAEVPALNPGGSR